MALFYRPSGGYGAPVAQFNPYAGGGFNADAAEAYVGNLGNLRNNLTQQYLGNLGFNRDLLLGIGGFQNNLALAGIDRGTRLGLGEQETERARISDAMQRYLGDLQLQGTRLTSENQLAGVRDTNLARRYGYDQQLAGVRSQAENARAADEFAAAQQLAGVRDTSAANMYGADRALQGQVASSQLANVPSFLRQSRFQQVLPLFQSVLGVSPSRQPTNAETFGPALPLQLTQTGGAPVRAGRHRPTPLSVLNRGNPQAMNPVQG